MNSEAKYYSRVFKCFGKSGFLSETLGHVEGRKQGWNFHIKVNVSLPEGPRIDVCDPYY